MDTTTNWNVETVSLLKDLFDLPPKDKALLILLGVFGLWNACTPKMNALQLVEWKERIHARNVMSAKFVLWFIFAKDLPFVIVTRWCLKVMGLINWEFKVVGSDKLREWLWGSLRVSSPEHQRRTSPMSKGSG
jgi:hypothetical protein